MLLNVFRLYDVLFYDDDLRPIKTHDQIAK